MKKTIHFLAALFFLAATLFMWNGCREASDEFVPISGSAAYVRGLLPAAYLPESSVRQVRFRDAQRNTKHFNIRPVNDGHSERDAGTYTLEVEDFQGYLLEDGGGLDITFFGGMDYDKRTGRSVQLLSILLSPFQASNPPWINIWYDNRAQILAPRIGTVLYDEFDLLDVRFDSVYAHRQDSGNSGYSELFFNSRFGVIGFRDGRDTLFVFDGFIQ